MIDRGHYELKMMTEICGLQSCRDSFIRSKLDLAEERHHRDCTHANRH